MIRAIGLLLFTSVVLAAQPVESQALQGLLEEVRQLRQDLRGLTLVSQRVQILLYRAQLQDQVVRIAAQRHDQANAKVKDADRAQAAYANGLKEAEDRLTSLQDPKQREEGEAIVREMKRRVEMAAQDQASYRAAEMETANELRTEQVKLSEIQQLLERLDQQLEKQSTSLTSK